MKKILIIEGMSCNHCVMAVKKALKEINGVESVNVNLEKKKAEVELNNVEDKKLKEAVKEAGYNVVEVK